MSENVIHYGIIGIGPVGLTVAAHLKKAGQTVSVLSIEDNKTKALMSHQLKVSGRLSALVKLDHVFTNLREFMAARPSVIIIATKGPDLPALLEDIKRLHPASGTVFVSCQNGLDIENRIVEAFGSSQTLRIVINMGCKPVNDHHMEVVFALTHFLSLRSDVDETINHRLADDLNRAGFNIELIRNYQTEVYKKVVLNSSLSTVCALTGLSMVNAMNDPDLYHIVRTMLIEALAVGQAMGLDLPADYLDHALKYLCAGGDHKPSMLVDMELKRRPENEDHCGRILFYAQKHNVPVPVLQTIFYLMRNLERRMFQMI